MSSATATVASVAATQVAQFYPVYLIGQAPSADACFALMSVQATLLAMVVAFVFGQAIYLPTFYSDARLLGRRVVGWLPATVCLMLLSLNLAFLAAHLNGSVKDAVYVGSVLTLTSGLSAFAIVLLAAWKLANEKALVDMLDQRPRSPRRRR